VHIDGAFAAALRAVSTVNFSSQCIHLISRHSVGKSIHHIICMTLFAAVSLFSFLYTAKQNGSSTRGASHDNNPLVEQPLYRLPHTASKTG
jgi:hypothetical protein